MRTTHLLATIGLMTILAVSGGCNVAGSPGVDGAFARGQDLPIIPTGVFSRR